MGDYPSGCWTLQGRSCLITTMISCSVQLKVGRMRLESLSMPRNKTTRTYCGLPPLPCLDRRQATCTYSSPSSTATLHNNRALPYCYIHYMLSCQYSHSHIHKSHIERMLTKLFPLRCC